MKSEVVFGLLRHVLTSLGGALVTGGYLGASEVEAGVGALITLIGIAWSIAHKKRMAG